MAEDARAQPKGKMVSLVWGEPGMTVFANQAVVQYDGNMVYLTFGQASPPVIAGETDEERQRQLDKVHSVAVLPVVRLAMAPASFRAVADALQRHIEMVEKADQSTQETK